MLEELILKSSPALYSAHLEGVQHYCWINVSSKPCLTSFWFFAFDQSLLYSTWPLFWSRVFHSSLQDLPSIFTFDISPLKLLGFPLRRRKVALLWYLHLVSFYNLFISPGNHTFSTSPASVFHTLFSDFERYISHKVSHGATQRSPACLERSVGKVQTFVFVIDIILKACACEAKSIFLHLIMLLKAGLRANHSWYYKERETHTQTHTHRPTNITISPTNSTCSNMYLVFCFSNLSLIDELTCAGFAACGVGRPAAIHTDRSKDRDSHHCYEQHFITVMFGQNSICRCWTYLLLSLRCVRIVGKKHTHKCCIPLYYLLLTAL